MAKYKATKLTCYVGLVVQAIVNNFLPILFIALQDVYGLGYEKLGRLILFNFVTQLIADGFTAKIVEKIGYRKAAVMCQGFAALGLTMLTILPRVMSNTYLAIVISLIVYSFASGLIEVILSPMVEMLPTTNKSSNMAVLHSFYCWGQAITIIATTLLLKVFGYINWNYIPIIWAIIPFLNMFSFMFVPVIEPKGDEITTPLSQLLKSREFKCFMVLMVCAGASEIAMSEWASLFAQKGLGVSKIIGDLAGPCAFALFMACGRIIYSRFSNRISVRKVLIAMNSLCVVCYLMVGLCNIPVFALIACAICGFSVSVSWPGTYSAACARFPSGGTWMFGILALCGDLGCSTGPWLLGVIADKSSLNAGFVISSVFPLIMLLTSIFFLKEKDCKIAA